MRIYDVNLTGTSAAESSRAQETQRSGTAGGGRTGGTGANGTGDRVEFSSTMGSLAQAMSADGSAREGRVQALATQYQSGSYQPNSVGSSKGMVSEALAMSGQ